MICAEQTLATQRSALSFHPLYSPQRSVFANPCVSSPPSRSPPPPDQMLKLTTGTVHWNQVASIERGNFGNSACGLGRLSWKHLICGPPWEELDLCFREKKRLCIQIMMPDLEPLLWCTKWVFSYPKWQASHWKNILEVGKKKKNPWQICSIIQAGREVVKVKTKHCAE